MATFFENLKSIERQTDEIIENIGLKLISEDEAKVMIKKKYKDFILSFHYPAEKDSPYLKNELKNETKI